MSSMIPDDPFGAIKKPVQRQSPPPEDVNRFHERADTDSSATAIHHTLGIKNVQAAPGDHKHDGIGSRKLMEGITITGSKGGNVALANLITQLAAVLGFTDATS